MRRLLAIAVVSLASVVLAQQATPVKTTGRPQYIGYHGPDGTQVYPNSNPPVEWDGKTGKNILWQTPLPYVSYGGVLAVRDRVFVMSEFGYNSDFPELVCVDANTGKIQWKREINHLSIAVPEEEQRKKVATAWHDHLAWRREYATLKAELDGAVGEEAKESVREKMRSKGMLEPEPKKAPENASSVSRWRVDKDHPEIGKAGLFFDAWRSGFGGWWPGSTFPTPCSDGESVFIATAWRQYACFDFDGNMKWMQWFPKGGGRTDKASNQTDGGDGCGANRSPLLWGDLFIADTFGWVRAFDKKTGRVAWEVSFCKRSEGVGGGHGNSRTTLRRTNAGRQASRPARTARLTSTAALSPTAVHIMRDAEGRKNRNPPRKF